MKDDLKDIEIINQSGTIPDIEKIMGTLPLSPFNKDTINYLHILSKELNKHPMLKNYPDVAAFSFFCRKANILSYEAKFNDKDKIRLGRGVIFHIAPSNVPVNFAFSLVAGLLSGNTNIVKVPSKSFTQIDIISSAINEIAKDPKFSDISKRIVLVKYDRNSNATKYFSSNCDVRIIWGGDQTIKEVRNNKLQARSFDLTFADRFSMCVINARNYNKESNPNKIARGFFNDTYLFDQNACTSPHLIIWIGSERDAKNAKKKFWESLYEILKRRYRVQSISAMNKLTAFCNQAMQTNDLCLEENKDNLLWRVELKNLKNDLHKFRSNSGYFLEFQTSSLIDISTIINRKYQTLSYYGFKKEEMKDLILNLNPVGIDRLVPIGRTMEFSLVWDGYNLIKSLSRRIEFL